MADPIGSAVMRYGAQMAVDEHNAANGNWGMIVYGAPPISSTINSTPTQTWQEQALAIQRQAQQAQQQAQQQVQVVQQAATRDEWWKWAAGVGLVSMAAYIIYQKVTEKK